MEPLFPNNDLTIEPEPELLSEDPETTPPVDLPLELDQLICDLCFEDNLTTNVGIMKCVVCEEAYCIHHASSVDASHCKECLEDVHVTFETIRRTEEHISPAGIKTTGRSRTARQIKLGGLHWLFAQRKIPLLSDTELAVAIEYHMATGASLIYEREVRRTKQAHRNAGIKFTSSVPSTTGTVVTHEIKKSKKIQITKPDKAAAQLQAALEALLKSGLTKEQIVKMAGGKK